MYEQAVGEFFPAAKLSPAAEDLFNFTTTNDTSDRSVAATAVSSLCLGIIALQSADCIAMVLKQLENPSSLIDILAAHLITGSTHVEQLACTLCLPSVMLMA